MYEPFIIPYKKHTEKIVEHKDYYTPGIDYNDPAYGYTIVERSYLDYPMYSRNLVRATIQLSISLLFLGGIVGVILATLALLFNFNTNFNYKKRVYQDLDKQLKTIDRLILLGWINIGFRTFLIVIYTILMIASSIY